MSPPIPFARCIAAAAVSALPLASTAATALSMADMLATCAPMVHPITMGKIVKVESGGKLYALSDDGPKGLPWNQRKKMLRSYSPATLDEAEALATKLIAANHLVGLGLSQLNSQHLVRFRLTIRQALEPCTNLNAGGRVLTDFYLTAKKSARDDQQAILAALSAYNTGSYVRGFENGYVDKVVNAGGIQVPALTGQYASPAWRPEVEPYSPPQLLNRKFKVLRVSQEEE